MANLEQFLQSFEHPLDWAGHTVETHPPLKVGDVVRLFFRWEEEESWNKHYVRILEVEDGPVFRGETIEVYPQWSLCDGYRVPLGAKLRFEPRHVYELPGFENGQICTWPTDEVNEQETRSADAADFIPLHIADQFDEEEITIRNMVDADYHECSDNDY